MGDVIREAELHPGEEIPLVANFQDEIASGETLASATATAIADSTGLAAPSGFLSGTPTVVSPRAQQKVKEIGVTGLVLGEDYLVTLVGSTSAGLDYVQRFRVHYRPSREVAPVLYTSGTFANTYATLAVADAYAAGRIGAEAWEASSRRRKTLALLAAARDVDALRLRGGKADVDFSTTTPTAYDQPLAFPRDYQIDDDGAFYVPDEIKEAQVEQALWLLRAGTGSERRLRLQAQGVQSFSVEVMSETYRPGAGAGSLRAWDRLCPEAQRLLARHVNWTVEVARA